MGKKAKSLLKISAIYLGTVLGAGFASGQELLLFFVRFSRRGLLGCLLAGGLFCAVGAFILSKGYELSEKSSLSYLRSIFGKPMAAFFELAIKAFLCISFCVMLSGSGAFFTERFSLPAYVGILATDLICLLVFLCDLKGLSAINVLLTPFMLAGTLYVCLYSLVCDNVSAWLPISHHGQFFPYALFYVGYNLLTAIAVLVPASALAENKNIASWGGVLGGACLTLLAVLCCLALFFEEAVWKSSMPLLMLSERAGNLAYGVYSAVLYMAMLTTAVSTGFSIVESLKGVGMGRKTSALLVCLAAIPLSFVEFSALVRRSYVFFGVLGILLIGGILWDWYRKQD